MKKYYTEGSQEVEQPHIFIGHQSHLTEGDYSLLHQKDDYFYLSPTQFVAECAKLFPKSQKTFEELSEEIVGWIRQNEPGKSFTADQDGCDLFEKPVKSYER